MKRTLSLLLAVLLLCSLAPAAFAVDETSQNKDYVAFYLTRYEVKSGDTLYSICSTRGIEYASYLSIIKNVNGIANENNLIAGRSYWLPAKTVGSATDYYTVYKHILVSGDTISALCSTYGISLSNNEALLKAVNNVTSLTNFMVGTSIFIPVSTSAASSRSPKPSLPTLPRKPTLCPILAKKESTLQGAPPGFASSTGLPCLLIPFCVRSMSSSPIAVTS